MAKSVIEQMVEDQEHPNDFVNEDLKEKLAPVRQSIPGTGVYSNKSKWTAFFLCFFLGLLGIHCFYVGRTGRGYLMAFLSGLTACSITSIIVLVDLFMIVDNKFTDKDGRILK